MACCEFSWLRTGEDIIAEKQRSHEEEEEEEKAEGGEHLAKVSEDEPHLMTDVQGETTAPSAAHLPDPDQRQDDEPDAQAEEVADEKEVINGVHPKSPSHSRHSSYSDQSRRDERPDSPITSMDEESKDRPQVQRRPSAKVHELVDTLDVLEKKHGDALTVPNVASGRRRSLSQGAISIRSARSDYASDFGDFEDAQSFNSDPTSRRPSVSGSPCPPSSPRAGRTRSLSRSSLRGSRVSKAATPPAIPEERENRFHQLRDKFGPLNFTPDLESIDKLFDVAKLDAEQPSAKDYSLDYIDGIINDSFTSISERKTWWRISRHGTMRKHDSGDDDNYRRITWASSKTREETNQIVRRWMEQDSYSGGRPSFGDAASVKGGAFNWNSRAEPLSMDQVFGKRKSTQYLKAATTSVPRPLSLQPEPRTYSHSRNLSTGVKSLPPRSPALNSLPPPSPLSIPGPPMSPAFGWSTATNGSASVTPASSRPPSRTVRRSIEVTSVNSANSRSIAPSINDPESRNSLQLAPPPVPPSVSPEKSNDPVPEVDEDDDDEWGEMVVSPPSTSRPVSGFFDGGMSSSLGNLLADKPASSPPPTTDTSVTLDAVSSKLELGQTTAKVEAAQAPSAVPAAHIWNFSAFETGPQGPGTPGSPMWALEDCFSNVCISAVKASYTCTTHCAIENLLGGIFPGPTITHSRSPNHAVENILHGIIPTSTTTHPYRPASTSTCIEDVYQLDRFEWPFETKFPSSSTDVQTPHLSRTLHTPPPTATITQHGPAITTSKSLDPEGGLATTYESSHRITVEEREPCANWR
ncbi:hypothetical protein VP1G_07008 [Cytospora mali]|uniref:Uncharacterized protein n=1 Tax=Cytospora mali TaxID=578113 RepID=A0A194V710_CYTMA|nr:hypothetical protein VP1G_07008 [Valsa mali var. pyri (nom. inval.)]